MRSITRRQVLINNLPYEVAKPVAFYGNWNTKNCAGNLSGFCN